MGSTNERFIPVVEVPPLSILFLSWITNPDQVIEEHCELPLYTLEE
jgi:hypothetical protein